MRVNYQGLLNQTLGAVGSTMSTLKFLHNQDPTVVEQKTQKAKQKQREEESELGAVDFDKMSSMIERKTVDPDSSDNVDLKGIFSKFNI